MDVRSTMSANGWFILDKPVGLPSTRAVSIVRRAHGARKAGHAGTLDPAASGVLAVALGEATKTVPHVVDTVKAYRFTMRIGQATDTDDAEGKILAETSERPSDDELKTAASGFTGEIDQAPPSYSAIKVDGKRAHALARSGTLPELPARKVRIDRIELVSRPDPDHAVFEMTCGKGVYVRALARDLGRALACLGHACEIRRTRTGPFSLADAMSLDTLSSSDGKKLAGCLLKPEAGLAEVPRVDCRPEEAARIRNGLPIPYRGPPAMAGAKVWIASEGNLVAIAAVRDSRLHPSRVFAKAGS